MLFNSRMVRTVTLVLIFGLAFAIRLYDLTDLPLDFHPTRQLLSALKARGMYYQSRGDVPEWQRKFAVQQWRSKAEIEPEMSPLIDQFQILTRKPEDNWLEAEFEDRISGSSE